MPLNDIRPLKAELREKYRRLRQEMPPEIKAEKDEAIAAQVRRLWQYRETDVLFTYVSTPIEVDTHRIIQQALEDGKTLAVPRCVPGTRQMEFYRIDSPDELESGAFGVLEPPANPARLMPADRDGLCLVPAFSYDWSGYRLGYGKGYYDRFLAQFQGHIVGICYSECVQRTLPHGRYDRPVELLVTDTYLRRIARR